MSGGYNIRSFQAAIFMLWSSAECYSFWSEICARLPCTDPAVLNAVIATANTQPNYVPSMPSEAMQFSEVFETQAE